MGSHEAPPCHSESKNISFHEQHSKRPLLDTDTAMIFGSLGSLNRQGVIRGRGAAASVGSDGRQAVSTLTRCGSHRPEALDSPEAQ